MVTGDDISVMSDSAAFSIGEAVLVKKEWLEEEDQKMDDEVDPPNNSPLIKEENTDDVYDMSE